MEDWMVKLPSLMAFQTLTDAVLINNAGIICLPSKDDLLAARNTYNEILNVNIWSLLP